MTDLARFCFSLHFFTLLLSFFSFASNFSFYSRSYFCRFFFVRKQVLFPSQVFNCGTHWLWFQKVFFRIWKQKIASCFKILSFFRSFKNNPTLPKKFQIRYLVKLQLYTTDSYSLYEWWYWRWQESWAIEFLGFFYFRSFILTLFSFNFYFHLHAKSYYLISHSSPYFAFLWRKWGFCSFVEFPIPKASSFYRFRIIFGRTTDIQNRL